MRFQAQSHLRVIHLHKRICRRVSSASRSASMPPTLCGKGGGNAAHHWISCRHCLASEVVTDILPWGTTYYTINSIVCQWQGAGKKPLTERLIFASLWRPNITKTVGALYEFMTILYKQNKYAMLRWHYIAFLTDKHYENACKLHTNHFVN